MLNTKRKRFYLGLMMLLCSQVMSFVQAQTTPFANTLSLPPGTTSPTARIADVAWMSGYWQGEMWGGHIEEVWSQPLASSMMASFKFAADQEVKFYEIITLFEHQGSLLLRLKHFSAELKGWEEKDDYMEFKLVKLDKHSAYFEGYTYRLVSPDELHVFVVIDDKGQKNETKFVFKRAK